MGVKKLFVGGLPWGVDDLRLGDLFRPYGKVKSAKVCLDRDSGKSRGFGFVEFDSETVAAEAKEGMDGAKIDGRAIRVNEAEEPRGGARRVNAPERFNREEAVRREDPRPPNRPSRKYEAYRAK